MVYIDKTIEEYQPNKDKNGQITEGYTVRTHRLNEDLNKTQVNIIIYHRNKRENA